MITKINTLKQRRIVSIILGGAVILSTLTLTFCTAKQKVSSQSTPEIIETNIDGTGIKIELSFVKGEEHNHPLMVVWTEDLDGKYLETLFVAESIGTGIFDHADKSTGDWEPGPVRRPAALPYWGHKRGYQGIDGYYIPDPENPMPDAVTGPTPKGDFTLRSKTGTENLKQFRILLEINQSWDWNTFWTNNKYPDDANYKTSSQPAIVYAAVIDLTLGVKEYTLAPLGHSHYSGADGSINPNLETLSTAKQIVESIIVKID